MLKNNTNKRNTSSYNNQSNSFERTLVNFMNENNIKVNFDGKEYDLLDFINLYNNGKITNEITWVKLPENVEMHVGYNHYCNGDAIFIPFIGVFTNSKILIFKCETCGKYYIGNDFLNSNNQLFNKKFPTLTKNSIPKSDEKNKKKNKKKTRKSINLKNLKVIDGDNPYDGLSKREKKNKWIIDHPWRG